MSIERGEDQEDPRVADLEESLKKIGVSNPRSATEEEIARALHLHLTDKIPEVIDPNANFKYHERMMALGVERIYAALNNTNISDALGFGKSDDSESPTVSFGLKQKICLRINIKTGMPLSRVCALGDDNETLTEDERYIYMTVVPVPDESGGATFHDFTVTEMSEIQDSDVKEMIYKAIKLLNYQS